MDILYFLGYDIDEELPWHLTLSRTRQLYPKAPFESLFERIFSLCVKKGMVAGYQQAVDLAPVKANAPIDSLLLKQPKESVQKHLAKVKTDNVANRPYKKVSSKPEAFISDPEQESRKLENQKNMSRH